MRARWLFSPVLVALALSAPVVFGEPTPAGAASAWVARAFVANNGDGDVSVLALATDTVVGASFVLGGGPEAVTTSPDGQRDRGHPLHRAGCAGHPVAPAPDALTAAPRFTG